MKLRNEIDQAGRNGRAADILAIAAGAVVPLIILLPIVFISRGIVLFPDEVGYWADAMTMAGEDWSGISLLFPWYSYGYSILLVPLIKLFDDPTVIYRAGLFLNLIMLEATYLMWIRLIRRLAENIKAWLAALISAAAVCLPTYLTYGGINLPEIALLFCFTALLTVFVSFTEKPTMPKAAAIAALGIWLYSIHNRMIGVVVVLAVVFVWLAAIRKIRLRELAAFIITAAVLTAAFLAGKHALTGELWPKGIQAANEAGDQVDKIKKALTPRGFVKLILIFFAQFGSVTVSTLGLMPLGLVYAVKRSVSHVRSKNIMKAMPFIFVGGAFVFSLGISSLFFIEPTRIDQLVYTRYVDTITGVPVMFGLLMLMEIKDKRSLITGLAATGAPVIVGMLCAQVLVEKISGLVYFNYVNAPGLSRLYMTNGDDFASYITLMIVFVLMIPAAAWLGRNRSTLTVAVTAALIALIMIYMSWPTVDWVRDRQNVYKASDDYLAEVRESGARVGYNSRTDIEYLEYAAFRLYDVPLSIISDEAAGVSGDGGAATNLPDCVILKSPVQE